MSASRKRVATVLALLSLLSLQTFLASANPVERGARTSPDQDGPGLECGAEAPEYRPIHRLEIPLQGAFHAGGVPYALDDSDADIAHFDRVAYCLVLQAPGQPPRYAYASMRAFTDDLGAIGLPAGAAAPVHQQPVQDLNVFSNAPGVPTGLGLSGGNLEIWPHNYATANAAGVPGASDSTYDYGDAIAADVPAGYGSLQVHHAESGTTLLAYNAWGNGGRDADLGIGNSPQGHPDWTFEGNAGAFLGRRLWVLVREAEPPLLALRLDLPTSRSVWQRGPDDAAELPIRGRVTGERAVELADSGRLEARALPRDARGTALGWQPLEGVDPSGAISSSLRISGGWYDLELRASLPGIDPVTATLERVGIGEVFVTAGQSNSANHGLPPLSPADDRVSALGPRGWQLARDPQPIATGAGGSPWPVLGDHLAAMLDLPIGFVSVGWGGTRVDQWVQTDGALYPRLRQALGDLAANRPAGQPALRAVLWHQGESDTVAGTSAAVYATRLGFVIRSSRDDAGWALPWLVARASYLPGTGPGPEIIAGQNRVIADDPQVLAGPETDDLIGAAWRHDTVHFNEAGLREHARRWAEALAAWPELVATPQPSATSAATATASATATATPSPTSRPNESPTPTATPRSAPSATATATSETGWTTWLVLLPSLTRP